MASEEKKKAFEATMGSLHRMAMKVLEAPEAEREAVYQLLHESFVEAQGKLDPVPRYGTCTMSNPVIILNSSPANC
jgi:hypothetical protein